MAAECENYFDGVHLEEPDLFKFIKESSGGINTYDSEELNYDIAKNVNEDHSNLPMEIDDFGGEIGDKFLFVMTHDQANIDDYLKQESDTIYMKNYINLNEQASDFEVLKPEIFLPAPAVSSQDTDPSIVKSFKSLLQKPKDNQPVKLDGEIINATDVLQVSHKISTKSHSQLDLLSARRRKYSHRYEATIIQSEATTSSLHGKPKGPGRPRKDSAEIDVEMKIAEILGDEEKVEKLKKNRSSKEYRDRKNEKLTNVVLTVEEYEKQKAQLLKKYNRNQNIISYLYAQLMRLS